MASPPTLPPHAFSRALPSDAATLSVSQAPLDRVWALQGATVVSFQARFVCRLARRELGI